MTNEQLLLNQLVQEVLASPKYRAISEDLIRAIGARELAARRGMKEAVKATKNKLHQVAGAYLDARPPYAQWLAQLEAAVQEPRTGTRRVNREPKSDSANGINSNLKPQNPGLSQDEGSKLAEVCREIMRHHASTRERLPILSALYTATLAGIQPVRSVLDVACGLNPLAIPWMLLEQDATYYACDLYADMVAFLNGFFRIAGIRGRAEVCDLVTSPPGQRVDLALVLKALPPLEQLDRRAGINLLRMLNADHMLVSFPARSLGGRAKGMAENYEQRFHAMTAGEGWAVERFAFATEIAFLVTKKQNNE
jgi:16S rRNA (guanine(1405)-N(7))-methyltransferase